MVNCIALMMKRKKKVESSTKEEINEDYNKWAKFWWLICSLKSKLYKHRTVTFIAALVL
jgi:hypothetical protein